MKKSQSSDINQKVMEWWDKNPFTLGVATNNYEKNDLVGRIPAEKMDLAYFNEIDRKFRKHSETGGQEQGNPLLSNLIDYSLIAGKKVLDIAVGSGLHTVAFAYAGAQVTGIDLTQFAVSQTKKNLMLRGLKGSVLQMDAQKMEFPDNNFDFVNAWGCLMHMPDTEKAIKEIHRVLKPGGVALAYMYNKNSWPYWFNLIFLRGILMGQLFRYRFNTVALSSRYADGYSVGGNVLTKFYTPEEVRSMFLDAGFSSAECVPWELPHEPNGWPARTFPIFRFLPEALKTYLRRFGYGLIIKANK